MFYPNHAADTSAFYRSARYVKNVTTLYIVCCFVSFKIPASKHTLGFEREHERQVDNIYCIYMYIVVRIFNIQISYQWLTIRAVCKQLVAYSMTSPATGCNGLERNKV